MHTGRVLGQDGVGRGAGTVAGHENGDVVGKGARMSRLAAALAGLARQTGAPALERLEDEGFVRFHNPLQHLRLVERRSAQEAMPPAIGRGRMDAAAFGRLGQADALDHRLRLIDQRSFLRNRAIPVPVAALKVRPHALHRYLGRPCDRPQPTISSAPQCAQPRRSTLRSPSVANTSPAILDALRLPPSPIDGSASGRVSADGRPTPSSDRLPSSPSSASARAICSPLFHPPHPRKPAVKLSRVHRQTPAAAPAPRHLSSNNS